jgi:ATP/maltotriose-dependent transcriptional regulator MalT
MEDEDLELFVAARLAYYDALNLDCENAERLISRSLEICRKRGPRVEHFMALYARTCCAGVCGTPREEHDRIRDELRRYAEESGTSHEYGMYQRVEATLQLRRGEWEAARRTAREMLAHVERPAEEFRGREAGAVLVGAALDTGEIDTARSYLRDIFRIPERAIDYSPRMALWNAVYRRPVNGLANLARSSTTSWNIGAPYVYVNSGLAYEARSARLLADEAACRRILRRALRWRGSLSLGATTAELACVDTLCGELTLFLGDTEDAIPHFEQADGILRRAGLGPHIAWNLMQLGLALATSGRTDRATRTFREAYKRAEELEMRPLMKLVADASVNAASVAAAGGDPLPDGLSSREAEVLSLVAEGYTNQEIGERLCISPHTVARHIHAVLDKTGMANRTEAGAYAVRHGLTR